jgi:hypothetical protein
MLPKTKENNVMAYGIYVIVIDAKDGAGITSFGQYSKNEGYTGASRNFSREEAEQEKTSNPIFTELLRVIDEAGLEYAKREQKALEDGVCVYKQTVYWVSSKKPGQWRARPDPNVKILHPTVPVLSFMPKSEQAFIEREGQKLDAIPAVQSALAGVNTAMESLNKWCQSISSIKPVVSRRDKIARAKALMLAVCEASANFFLATHSLEFTGKHLRKARKALANSTNFTEAGMPDPMALYFRELIKIHQVQNSSFSAEKRQYVITIFKELLTYTESNFTKLVTERLMYLLQQQSTATAAQPDAVAPRVSTARLHAMASTARDNTNEVVIFGLRDALAINGLIGVVKEYCQDRDRYIVQLTTSDGEAIERAVKLKNIFMCDPEKTNGVGDPYKPPVASAVRAAPM